MIRYHDHERDGPARDDRKHFEFLVRSPSLAYLRKMSNAVVVGEIGLRT